MRQRSSDNNRSQMWFVILSASEEKNKLATFVISLSAFTLWSSFGVRSAWSSASVSGTLLTQSNFDLRFPADLPLASRQACELSFHTKQELFLCNNEKLRKKIESRDQKWMSAFEEVFFSPLPIKCSGQTPSVLCTPRLRGVFLCLSCWIGSIVSALFLLRVIPDTVDGETVCCIPARFSLLNESLSSTAVLPVDLFLLLKCVALGKLSF